MKKIKGLLTEAEVCAALDIDKRQLRRCRDLGLRYHSVNRELHFYIESEVLAFFESLPSVLSDKLGVN